jgi:hypothetical protein
MLSLPFLAIHSRWLSMVSVTAKVNAIANSLAHFILNMFGTMTAMENAQQSQHAAKRLQIQSCVFEALR